MVQPVSKNSILEPLCWDSSVITEELLPLVDGVVSSVGDFSRESLFLRTLERVPWYNLILLWNGAENCTKFIRKGAEKGFSIDSSDRNTISHSDLYEENLYKLQDGVLSIVKNSDELLYLTGGTTLSRAYYHHRYSDDLDFFFNNKGILMEKKHIEQKKEYVAPQMNVLLIQSEEYLLAPSNYWSEPVD